MLNIRINEEVYYIKTKSSVYEEYVKCLEVDEMDLSEHFIRESVKTLQDITENKISNASIDVDTYRLIDFLDLNYLLFNHSIQENSSVTNERIKEYYKIMKSPKDKDFLKNLLSNLGQHAIKLLNYKRLRGFIDVCDEAVKINNLECLKYAHKNVCPWNEYTCTFAAENGHLECLKYAYENGCPWNEYTCAITAKYGHLDCLKYAHKNGCPWNEFTCAYASLNGHLDCLKYAHDNGCPWDELTCAYAALNGHLECLRYAHENNCPWNKYTCLKAIQLGHLECLKYACNNECPSYEEYIHLL
jgi:hypothetical protein